jgi:hypothetical protein
MDALLDRLSPGQIVAVISIVVGGVVALAMIVAISKFQFQALADDTAIRQEKQQADLVLREKLIERREASGERASIAELLALGATPPGTDLADSNLAKRFGMLDASSDEIERTLVLALSQDGPRKKMIAAVMDELLNAGADSGAILAAVRPLCAAAVPAKEKCGPVVASVA